MKSRRHGIVDYWFSVRGMNTPFSTSTVVDSDSDANGWAPFDLPPLSSFIRYQANAGERSR
jgi:hypothetical protein